MGFVGSYVWKLRQALGSQRLIIAGVAMFITNAEGKVWLGKRAGSGEWSYFGGALELGDSVMDAVCRETQEELGLATQPSDWTYVGLHSLPEETSFSYPNGDAVQVVNHVFSLMHENPLGEPDDEHTEFGWFDIDNLPQPLKVDNPHTIRLFRDFLQTGKVQVR